VNKAQELKIRYLQGLRVKETINADSAEDLYQRVLQGCRDRVEDGSCLLATKRTGQWMLETLVLRLLKEGFKVGYPNGTWSHLNVSWKDADD